MRPDDILKVARGVGPEAVEGDVAGASEPTRERGGAVGAEEDLDVEEGGKERGKGRGGKEEEPVEDEEARERSRGDTRGDGRSSSRLELLGFRAQPTGESEKAVVVLVVRVRNRRVGFILARSSFKNGG